ncbi:toll-like receptor 3 [Saccostrea cucullata]|uniref:toll-like receptor 3 n=1 Tax=Saccostrea cuccullata TaxID=36930 RepID=UPI002ED1C84D
MRRDTVCACSTVYKWQKSELNELVPEFLSRRGNSHVLFSGDKKKSDYYYISVTKSFLRMLPENLCDFPFTVSINFTHNKIETLRNFSCVEKLTFLDLSHNRIRDIYKSFFHGLSLLWDVNLSFNEISYIEPGTFNDESLSLNNLDVSHNSILVLDLSNLLLSKTFCNISYAGNKIASFTNKADDPIKYEDNFSEVGFFDLSFNNIDKIPSFEELNLGKGYSFLGKVIFNRFIFQVISNPIVCDCFLEEMLWNLRNVKHTFKTDSDFLGYTCSYPANLQNVSIVKSFVYNNSFDELVCKLPKCPRNCECVFQSSQFRIIIDCTENFNGKALPTFNFTDMVESVKGHSKLQETTIHLQLSGRQVETIDNRSFFPNLSYIDLSNNKVKTVKESFFLELSRVPNIKINFTSNRGVLKLPNGLQLLNPKSVVLNNVTIACDCELMSWFMQWLTSREKDLKGLGITCRVNSYSIPIQNVTDSDLGCSQDQNENFNLVFVIGGFLVFLVIVFFVYSKYGHYFLVFRKCLSRSKQHSSFRYDVYVSIDEENEEVLRYVGTEFLPMLENFSLKTFMLARDSEVGSVMEECMIESMKKSRIYLFFLTSTVLTKSESVFVREWKHAWNNYKSNNTHDIFFINFDLLRLKDISDKNMRACMVFGKSVNFSDFDFEDKIKKSLKRGEVRKQNPKVILTMMSIDLSTV